MLFIAFVGIVVAVLAKAVLVDRRRNRALVSPDLHGHERRKAVRAERARWNREHSGTAGAWYLGYGDGGGFGGHGGFGGGHGGCGDGGGFGGGGGGGDGGGGC